MGERRLRSPGFFPESNAQSGSGKKRDGDAFRDPSLGESAVALRAAGEEALDEIERLEEQLSLYRPSSELSNINACAATRSVRVEPKLFRLLQRAQRLSVETGGAFDVTIAPLMKCWGFVRGTGGLPDPEELKDAQSKVGMQLITLDEDNFTVRFHREGVMIDLGSVGKGYALDVLPKS